MEAYRQAFTWLECVVEDRVLAQALDYMSQSMKYFSDFGIGKDFLKRAQNAPTIKAKIG